MMQVSWESAARAFFDQLSKREQTLVERSLTRLANNWEQRECRHLLQRLRDLASKDGHPIFQLRVGRDLRVLLYRQGQLMVVDIVRHGQIEGLRSVSGLRPWGSLSELD